MEVTENKDTMTYNMALTILEREVEHEEDLDLMVQRGLLTRVSHEPPIAMQAVGLAVLSLPTHFIAAINFMPFFVVISVLIGDG